MPSQDHPVNQSGLDDTELAAKSDAVCRMGALMVSAGTVSFRVKTAMGRVARALGMETLEAQVTLNEIVATTRMNGLFRTQVVEAATPTVDSDRIGALMRISLQAAPGITAAELNQQLDAVEHRRPIYPKAVTLLATAVACGAFAVLNDGDWQHCLAAALAAFGGKGAQLICRRFRLNHLALVATASAVACLLYVALVDLLRWLIPSTAQNDAASFISAVLFLVPGFPLMTAALDLARFDFVSGMSRLLHALMITLAVALGACVAAWTFGLTAVRSEVPALPFTWALIIRVVASFGGVAGFAITFNSPLRVAMLAAVIGAGSNTVNYLTLTAGSNSLLSATLSTTLAGLLAGWIGQRIPAPRITLSVPAVLIMVPGTSAYLALLAMINGDAAGALANGFAALSTVIALAAGLAIARMLTDPAWISANPEWTHMPTTAAQRALRSRGFKA